MPLGGHRTLRLFLGHSSVSHDQQYHLRTVIDNVELPGPELLSEAGDAGAGRGLSGTVP